MPTIIAFHPAGFEVRFDVDLGEIADMVRRLEQRRYRPSRELSYTAEGLPFCPRHGVPMQKREKQGDTWYSHKVTDPPRERLATAGAMPVPAVLASILCRQHRSLPLK